MELQTTFFLAEAPRSVPLSLRLNLLLGGVAQFGWLFAGFGMIFVWVFAGNADLSGPLFWQKLERAPGTVTYVSKTNFSEGGGEHSDGTPVYEFHYAFAGPEGVKCEGVSYHTGAAQTEGTAVTVEYPKGRPDLARIVGMRRAPFAPWVMFVVVFPIIGLCFVLYRFAAGRKAIRLLRDGALALGTLKSKVATKTEVNERKVYKLTFDYTAGDGQTYTLVTKTTNPGVLEDEEQEKVLYDPNHPDYAVMLDALPGAPRIDEQGQFQPAGAKLLLALVLPLATIIGHGVYAYTRLAG